MRHCLFNFHKSLAHNLPFCQGFWLRMWPSFRWACGKLMIITPGRIQVTSNECVMKSWKTWKDLAERPALWTKRRESLEALIPRTMDMFSMQFAICNRTDTPTRTGQSALFPVFCVFFLPLFMQTISCSQARKQREFRGNRVRCSRIIDHIKIRYGLTGKERKEKETQRLVPCILFPFLARSKCELQLEMLAISRRSQLLLCASQPSSFIRTYVCKGSVGQHSYNVMAGRALHSKNGQNNVYVQFSLLALCVKLVLKNEKKPNKKLQKEEKNNARIYKKKTKM